GRSSRSMRSCAGLAARPCGERPAMRTADLRLVVSTFPAPAKTSTRPTRKEIAWRDLVAGLSQHERLSDKDGRGWTAAEYRPGTTRASTTSVTWSCAVGDCDHYTVAEYEGLKARLA